MNRAARVWAEATVDLQKPGRFANMFTLRRAVERTGVVQRRPSGSASRRLRRPVSRIVVAQFEQASVCPVTPRRYDDLVGGRRPSM